MRWAEKLTESDEDAVVVPPKYMARIEGEDYFGHVGLSLREQQEIQGEEVHISTCASPTGRKRRHSSAYNSERVRRVVARLRSGGNSQIGLGFGEDGIMKLEGDTA